MTSYNTSIFSSLFLMYRCCVSPGKYLHIFMENADEEHSLHGDFTVNEVPPKVNRLSHLILAHLSVFKSCTSFFPGEFEDVCKSLRML